MATQFNNVKFTFATSTPTPSPATTQMPTIAPVVTTAAVKLLAPTARMGVMLRFWHFLVSACGTLLLLAIGISVTSLLVAFIKSLRPMYCFTQKPEPIAEFEEQKPPAGNKETNISTALTTEDLDKLFDSLSWKHTRQDVETLHWLNKSLASLWPTVKSLIPVNTLTEEQKAIRMRDAKLRQLVASYLSKPKPKMVLLLSCRRKIEFLKREAIQNRDTSNIGFLLLLQGIMNLAGVYFRQLINDFILYFALQENEQGDQRERLIKELDESETKLSSPTKLTHIKKQPSAVKQNKIVKSILKPKVVTKVKKALKFVAKQKIDNTRKIELGDSTPKINAIKFIEDPRQLLKSTARSRNDKTSYRTPVLPNDSRAPDFVDNENRTMRFQCEAEYSADSRFMIPLGSIFHVSKLAFKLRFEVSVNHATIELNQQNSLLDTPNEVLFPVVNHVRLVILDMPYIDWSLDTKLADLARINFKIAKLIDIVDHNYFKYMVNCVIYLVLKWFKPFDIKIGNSFYIGEAIPRM